MRTIDQKMHQFLSSLAQDFIEDASMLRRNIACSPIPELSSSGLH